MSALEPWDVLLTVRAKGLMGITVFLYVLLGAVFWNQLCLFPVFSPAEFLLSFGVFTLGFGGKGHHHHKLYVPALPVGD